MAMQGRVVSEASGQQKVANYFKSKHNATIISVATPGSNTTDIVLTIITSGGVEYYRKDIPEKGIKAGDLRGVLRTALKVRFNLGAALK